MIKKINTGIGGVIPRYFACRKINDNKLGNYLLLFVIYFYDQYLEKFSLNRYLAGSCGNLVRIMVFQFRPGHTRLSWNLLFILSQLADPHNYRASIRFRILDFKGNIVTRFYKAVNNFKTLG